MNTHSENAIMIEGQIKPLSGINSNVLDALHSIDRVTYVPFKSKNSAYVEKNIPLEGGRYLPKCSISAKLISALDVTLLETILIIGSTTGYSAAVASKIAETIICIEEDPELIEFSENAVLEDSINNVVFIQNKLISGYPEQAPYTCVLIEGAIEEVPNTILDQLADNGRLVTIICENDSYSAIKYRKNNNQILSEFLFSMDAPMLLDFKKPKKFQF